MPAHYSLIDLSNNDNGACLAFIHGYVKYCIWCLLMIHALICQIMALATAQNSYIDISNNDIGAFS